MAAPKLAQKLVVGDVVPSRGLVTLTRWIGPVVVVKFASGSTKFYRRGTRVDL
ncbi:MAG: hypothetical protein NVS3B1_07880 [Marmoricola sp.]